MIPMKSSNLFCFILLLVGLLPVAAQPQPILTIFAAASLTNAFDEIADNFIEQNPDVDILFNFASSSTLSSQLAEGAPADVFASANLKQVQVAAAAGRIQEPVTIFARNRLIVITPADNPANLSELSELAQPGIKLIFAAPGVPVRDYTDIMLETLAEDAKYGDTYTTAVLANVVSEEDNVRQVVAKIALGEADAGIVYQSDVTPDLNDLIATVPIPDEVNSIAVYPIAMTNDSANPDVAGSFIEYVLSDSGQAILEKWNFIGKCPMKINLSITSTPDLTPTAATSLTPDPYLIGCTP